MECPRGDCTKKPRAVHDGVFAGQRWWCVMTTADRVIRMSTALAVVGVAAVAVVLNEHASALVQAQGESGWTGRLIQ
jgi:hypothetical protein